MDPSLGRFLQKNEARFVVHEAPESMQMLSTERGHFKAFLSALVVDALNAPFGSSRVAVAGQDDAQVLRDGAALEGAFQHLVVAGVTPEEPDVGVAGQNGLIDVFAFFRIGHDQSLIWQTVAAASRLCGSLED